jgi:hypothetical protein
LSLSTRDDPALKGVTVAQPAGRSSWVAGRRLQAGILVSQSSPWPRSGASQLPARKYFVADRDRDVWVVAEQTVDAELVEQPQLGWEVTGRLQVDRAGRVALAEVLGQEGILPAEGPGVEQ